MAFRIIQSLLVLIRVYPRVSAADFSFCTNLSWHDLVADKGSLLRENVLYSIHQYQLKFSRVF
jgi:hypothetical protein